MNKILVYGVYGMDNLGDDFMMECIKMKLKDNNLIPVFFERNDEKYYFTNTKDIKYLFPVELKYKSKVKKIVEIIKWLFNKNDRKEYKALVFMGGGYINEQFGLKNLLRIYLLCFKYRKHKIYFTGQSAGPHRSFLGKMIIKKIYSFGTKIAVREKTTSNYLNNLGIKHELIGDDAYLIQNVGFENSKKYTIFNCKDFSRYENYKSEYFNFLLNISKNCNNKILIIPFRSDIESKEYKLNKELYNFLKSNNINCDFVVEKDLDRFIKYYSLSNLVIGTAYHSIVLGLIFKNNVFSFYSGDYYKMKINGILEWYDLDKTNSADLSNIKTINNYGKIAMEEYYSSFNDITDNIKRKVNAFWDMIIKDVNNE